MKGSLENEVNRRSESARNLINERRTLLASILGYSGLLKTNKQKTSLDVAVNSLNRSSSELNGKVGEFLELTKAILWR